MNYCDTFRGKPFNAKRLYLVQIVKGQGEVGVGKGKVYKMRDGFLRNQMAYPLIQHCMNPGSANKLHHFRDILL